MATHETTAGPTRLDDQNAMAGMTLLQGGDVSGGIAEIHQAYGSHLAGYIGSILPYHATEDTLHDLYERLILKSHTFEDKGVPLFAWVLTMARNLSIDHIRKNNSTRCVARDVLELAPEQSIHASPAERVDPDSLVEDRDAVFTALSELPAAQRHAVYGRAVLGLDPGELAERMNTTESAVHGLYHRGRHNMRRALSASDAEPSVRPSQKKVITRKSRQPAITDLPVEKAA